MAAIGHLFSTGELLTERVISLAGPQVQRPRLLRTRLGASIADLTEGELKDGENRLISGSIWGGRLAQVPLGYLGRFHNQVSVLREGREKKLFGWAMPDRAKFSVKPAFLSTLWPGKKFAFTTAVNGSKRPLIPIGRFEKVMPLDTEPTFLLRALLLQDTEQAQALGCLDMDEEDLALATFVDLSKNDFGSILRENLRRIEKRITVLKKFLAKQRRLFEKHGKLANYQPIFEALDSFLYTSGQVTPSAPHVRDGFNMKKAMGLVVIALIPCTLAGLYNTGLQANLALAHAGLTDPAGWRFDLLRASGLGFAPHSIGANVLHGFLYFFPVLLVSYLVGGAWEVVFSCLRNQEEIYEGFLVTGLMFSLILPPTIPLWLVALGISFGVVIGKLIFGGTGRNFLNPALTGRAFLFFSYPAALSGERVWTVAVDGVTGATPLGRAAAEGVAGLNVTWGQAFLGLIPGSMGETSTLACLLGAAILLSAGIASWRIMLSICIGMVSLALLFNSNTSATNPMFAVTPAWHFVLGGFAFGSVFMATDPVTSAVTTRGQWLYGLLIGVMAVLIRVLNPGFPEGMMLAILFGNCLAPLIDYLVVQRNMQRRLARHGSL